MTVKAITAANFDELLESHDLLIIDFWAQWCGPCKAFGKVMDSVSKEAAYSDVGFASVDIENEKALAEEFVVRSVPFVMIIRNRTVVYAESGALPESALRELIQKAKTLDVSQLSEK